MFDTLINNFKMNPEVTCCDYNFSFRYFPEFGFIKKLLYTLYILEYKPKPKPNQNKQIYSN